MNTYISRHNATLILVFMEVKVCLLIAYPDRLVVRRTMNPYTE
jgi:hypothetical protein